MLLSGIIAYTLMATINWIVPSVVLNGCTGLPPGQFRCFTFFESFSHPVTIIFALLPGTAISYIIYETIDYYRLRKRIQ